MKMPGQFSVTINTVTEKLAHAMTDMAPNIDLSILARDQQLIEQSADIRGALNDLLKQTDLIDVP
ncbi:hypothetical protein [Roseovarius sp. 217]|uniref:hypothetical protein n=1 Tax=Roseovarius sp. (strain 217) TaxID=314264 RepID=UPI0012EEB59A|nr:hypothetical protein [Roseovarius sp. 217]